MSMSRKKMVEMGLTEEQITKILEETQKEKKNQVLRYQPGNLKEIRKLLFSKNRTVRGILDWLEDRDETDLDEDGYWTGSVNELGTMVVQDEYIVTKQEGPLVVGYYLSKKDLTDCGVEIV